MKEIVIKSPYEALPHKLGSEAEMMMQLLKIARGVRASGAPLDTPSIKHVVRNFRKELKMFGIGRGTRQQVSSTNEGFLACAVNNETKRAVVVHESGRVVWAGNVPDRGTHIDPRNGKILDRRTLFIGQYIVPPGCLTAIVLCGALAWSALSGNSTESPHSGSVILKDFTPVPTALLPTKFNQPTRFSPPLPTPTRGTIYQINCVAVPSGQSPLDYRTRVPTPNQPSIVFGVGVENTKVCVTYQLTGEK